jgi:hypothetical protein
MLVSKNRGDIDEKRTPEKRKELCKLSLASFSAFQNRFAENA